MFVSGNPAALGIEAEGTTGLPMLARQRASYERTAAALLRGLEREPFGPALWIPDYLADEGLDPEVLPGFATRGRPGLRARCLVCHHIGLAGPGDSPGLRVVTFGRAGLVNALCNVHLSFTGRPTAVAANVAWHAGRGGWTVLYPAACAHHEWRAEKPDPWGLLHADGGMYQFRKNVLARLTGAPTRRGLFMYLSEEEEHEILDFVRGHGQREKGIVDDVNAHTNAVVDELGGQLLHPTKGRLASMMKVVRNDVVKPLAKLTGKAGG